MMTGDAEPLCNLQRQIDDRAAVCINQNGHVCSSITHRNAFAVRKSASLKVPAAVPFKGAVCATRCKPTVQGADIIALPQP